jgi:hypothetical protein
MCDSSDWNLYRLLETTKKNIKILMDIDLQTLTTIIGDLMFDEVMNRINKEHIERLGFIFYRKINNLGRSHSLFSGTRWQKYRWMSDPIKNTHHLYLNSFYSLTCV